MGNIIGLGTERETERETDRTEIVDKKKKYGGIEIGGNGDNNITLHSDGDIEIYGIYYKDTKDHFNKLRSDNGIRDLRGGKYPIYLSPYGRINFIEQRGSHIIHRNGMELYNEIFSEHLGKSFDYTGTNFLNECSFSMKREYRIMDIVQNSLP
jgi:hypothetical protein